MNITKVNMKPAKSATAKHAINKDPQKPAPVTRWAINTGVITNAKINSLINHPVALVLIDSSLELFEFCISSNCVGYIM